MNVADMKKTEDDAERELEALRQAREAGDTPAPDEGTPNPADTAAPATEDTTPKPGETPAAGLATPPGEVIPSAVIPQPGPKPEETVAFWKEEARKDRERYAALYGKYMHETAPLAAKVKEAQELLAAKDVEISDLKGKLGTLPEAAIPPGGTVNTAIEKMRLEHGDIFADMMLELVTPIEKANADLRSSVEKLTSQLEETKKGSTVPTGEPAPTESPVQKFWTDLTLKVPDWPDINDGPRKPKWIIFLGTTNPASGRTWQEELDYHHAKGNVGGDGNAFGVADVFNTFKRLEGLAPSPVTVPAKPVLTGLEEHTDPSTIGGGAKPSSEPVITYTQAEIDAFDDDVRKGRAQKHMTAAEIQKRFDDFDRAATEGRVR